MVTVHMIFMERISLAKTVCVMSSQDDGIPLRSQEWERDIGEWKSKMTQSSI